MNTCFKEFAPYNILQYLCDFIHVLIFVTVSKCQKSPKLMNIVIYNKYTQVSSYFQRNLWEIKFGPIAMHSFLKLEAPDPRRHDQLPVIGGLIQSCLGLLPYSRFFGFSGCTQESSPHSLFGSPWPSMFFGNEI